MRYQFRFGSLGKSLPVSSGKRGGAFRLAVLGDFSARANRGQVQIGEELAARKPLPVDFDDLDDLLCRLNPQLELDIGGEEGTVPVSIGSMDDFHPDELYDNLDVFSYLSSLRQRLTNPSLFAKAAAEVQSWTGVAVPPAGRRRKRRPRGSSVAAHYKLDDFAQLVQRECIDRVETSVDQLVQRLVAPHVVPAPDPRQESLLAAVDAAISDTMRRVLHHPDFQTTEALWRSIDLLVRRLELGPGLQIVLYDVTAEELAADLSAAESLEETGLYGLLVEQPALDAARGPFSAFVGNYQFEQTPPHAELLGRLAKIAAAAQAPWIAAIGSACLDSQRSRAKHALIDESWTALQQLPEAAHLALTVPRFLIRHPYGQKTDPVDRFDFEEFTPQDGLRGMLWGNSAILAGLLLAQTAHQQGLTKMNLGSVLTVDDLPFYYYTDADGDQIALPCTERLISVRMAAEVTALGFIPVLALRGRPEIRLGGWVSLAGTSLAGPWPAPAGAPPPTASRVSTRTEEEPKADDTADDTGDTADDEDEDLEAMLAGLDDSDSDSSSESGADDTGGPGDDDLDALLASLDDSGDSEDASSDEEEGELDPDLAALLADL